MNWRRDRDNWELLGREVERSEEKRWVMVMRTRVIFMILRSHFLDDTCLHANRLQLVLLPNFAQPSPWHGPELVLLKLIREQRISSARALDSWFQT